MKLNRSLLKRLLSIYQRTQLAKEFGISLPTLRRYINGAEPTTAAITESINRKMEQLRNPTKHQHPEWRNP
jgi:DNA transposition AAA+ family ATPase